MFLNNDYLMVSASHLKVGDTVHKRLSSTATVEATVESINQIGHKHVAIKYTDESKVDPEMLVSGHMLRCNAWQWFFLRFGLEPLLSIVRMNKSEHDDVFGCTRTDLPHLLDILMSAVDSEGAKYVRDWCKDNGMDVTILNSDLLRMAEHIRIVAGYIKGLVRLEHQNDH